MKKWELAAVLPLGTLALSALALRPCGPIHPALRFALETVWCWKCLTVKGLKDESADVYRELTSSNLEETRRMVVRIVGLDTEGLAAEGIIKGCRGDDGGELL